MAVSDISDLSQIIGELRNFAAQQISTNTHMLEELKKISERMSTFGEVGATFIEYRKTLHERFNKIHGQFGEMDERIDKLETKQEHTHTTLTAWKAQLKTQLTVLWITGTVVSALVSVYGGFVLKTLAAHTP